MKAKPYTVETVGRGKSRQVLVRQGRHQWTGKDLRLALVAREADLNRMLAERFTDPVCIRMPDGDTLVAHCGLEGWNYQHYRAEPTANGEVELRYGGSIQTGRDRHKCERDMRRHAADLAVKIGAESDGWPVVCDGLSYLKASVCEVEDIVDQLAKVCFVRGFMIAKARGDSEAHAAGCKASDDMRRSLPASFHSLPLTCALVMAGNTLRQMATSR